MYDVPAAIDDDVARVKLETVKIDTTEDADRLHEQLELLKCMTRVYSSY